MSISILNTNKIYVINDFFVHGGHVKSFVTQLNSCKMQVEDLIVCSENGYIMNNIHRLHLDKNKIRTIDLSKLRLLQFNWELFKILKTLLKDDSILHIYSFDCYFSALLAKSYYKNVAIINSVMGGPNPFPLLESTDFYIAVSKEQKEYALDNGYFSSNKDQKITVIKNRIEIPKKESTYTNEKNVLVISRFDSGMTQSLDILTNVLKSISKDIKITVAGTGDLLGLYSEKLKDFKNIEFIGYCNNLNAYREKASVVLGMGRSILESLLLGKISIVIGYSGIQLLEKKEHVKFASDYNFAGRKTIDDVSVTQCVERIEFYSKNNYKLDKMILDYLHKEYSSEYFKEKYMNQLRHLSTSNINKLQIFREYTFIFYTRIKRKFKV